MVCPSSSLAELMYIQVGPMGLRNDQISNKNILVLFPGSHFIFPLSSHPHLCYRSHWRRLNSLPQALSPLLIAILVAFFLIWSLCVSLDSGKCCCTAFAVRPGYDENWLPSSMLVLLGSLRIHGDIEFFQVQSAIHTYCGLLLLVMIDLVGARSVALCKWLFLCSDLSHF